MVIAVLRIYPLVEVETETTGGIMIDQIVIMIDMEKVGSVEIIMIIQSNQKLEDWAETLKVERGCSRLHKLYVRYIL